MDSKGAKPQGADDVDISVDVNLKSQTNSLANAKPQFVVKVGQFQATSERTIKDILTQETLLSTFEVQTTTEVGQVLAKFAISPERLHPPGESSRISFLSSLFKFWRGDIMLQVIFTKTILQQLKIALVFVPGANISDAPPTKEQIMMFSHKKIINPANEAEVNFIIPFVSDRPFLPMTSSTGVVYFVLYQPFTGSLDTGTHISFDVFVKSDKMEFHEFGLIPSYSSRIDLPNNLLFLFSSPTGTPALLTGAAGSYSYVSDSGAVVNGATYTTTDDLSGIANFVIYAVTSLFTTEVDYNNTMLRLYGSDTRFIFARGVIFRMDATHAGSGTIYYTNDSACFSSNYINVNHSWLADQFILLNTPLPVSPVLSAIDLNNEIDRLNRLLNRVIYPNDDIVDCVENRGLIDGDEVEINDLDFGMKKKIKRPKSIASPIGIEFPPDPFCTIDCSLSNLSDLSPRSLSPESYVVDYSLSDFSNQCECLFFGPSGRAWCSHCERDGTKDAQENLWNLPQAPPTHLSRDQEFLSHRARNICCTNKIGKCEALCSECRRSFVGSKDDCRCIQHYCCYNPKHVPHVVVWKPEEVSQWVQACLDSHQDGAMEVNPLVDDHIQYLVLGELEFNTAAVFSGPTALLTRFEEGKWSFVRFFEMVHGVFDKWAPLHSTAAPLFLAKMWYLHYRCSAIFEVHEMNCLDALMRDFIRSVFSHKYIIPDPLHTYTKPVTRARFLEIVD